MTALNTIVPRLCRVSRERAIDPERDINWPASLAPETWCMSPELLSLYAMPAYEEMPEAQRRRLSLLEAANFFSLNIHGERLLLRGIAGRLYSGRLDHVASYLHHFLEEENRHMVYFARFCTQYAGKIYPDRKVAFDRAFDEGEEDLTFFARVLVFEEIVDALNTRLAADSRVAPVVRAINLAHHLDETRHLVFGRLLVQHLFEQHAPIWPGSTLEAFRRGLAEYLAAVWQDLFNPDVYRDLGLGDVMSLRRRAFASTHARQLRREVSAGCVGVLLETGLLAEEPNL